MLYAYPLVGRFGLCHSLMAWARCYVWSHEHQIPMIAPSWRHLRLGPYLRREMDKRQYQRLFHFPGYVTGFKRLWLLSTVQKHPAERLGPEEMLQQNGIVVFNNLMSKNEETYMPKLLSHQQMIRQGVLEMTKPKYIPANESAPYISIHVRMGDFFNCVSEEALKTGVKNAQIPVEWYANMLKAVREKLGKSYPAKVFSDGTNEGLKPLLSQDNITRSNSISAITDVLGISNSKLLISSGSGFSQWGSFLGRVPRVCFPGQKIVQALQYDVDAPLEVECQSSTDIPESFMKIVFGTN